MTEERIAEIEANLLATTDQIGKLMDLVMQKNFVVAFVCNHSGLLLPGNYVKDWGRNGIGIGLGPHPVSEVLDTDYDTAPAVLSNDLRRREQVMHPVGNCFAQVDRVLVSAEEYEARAAILDAEDPDMLERIAVIRPKQLVNPRSKLRLFEAAWDRSIR